MPGFLTDFVNNKVLDCFFGGVAIDPPSTLHVGLSLTRACKGGQVAEPPGGAYARVAVPNDLTRFLKASAGSKVNVAPITFPEPSADWGAVLSVFIADAAEGGHVLAMADLPAPRSFNSGDPAPTIAINALLLRHV